MNKQVRRYVFTLNNYTEEHWTAVKEHLPTKANYAIVGREVGDEKQTEHLQGYVELSIQTRFSTILSWWEETILVKPHIETAKGSSAANRMYCSKQGNYWEHGDARQQGQRMDLIKFKEAIKAGKEDLALLEDHTAEFFKYGKHRNEIRAIYANEEASRRAKARYAAAELRPWQKQVISSLDAQSDRQVLWVFDKEGGVGKTWLANYLRATRSVFYLDGGKKLDVAHAYNRQPIVIFDFPRSKQDYVQYDIIESFKNGTMFSGKYNSHNKDFDPCKVLIFANFPPKLSELSMDRWQVLQFLNGSREEVEFVQNQAKEKEANNKDNFDIEQPITTKPCSHNNCNEINCFCECHYN